MIVTAITEKYISGFFHFYNSFRLNNDFPITCYLINFSGEKAKLMTRQFPDVTFRVYMGNFKPPEQKWQPSGILKVTYLKGLFLRKEAERSKENKKVIWIDPSKLIMGKVDFMYDLLNDYEWVGIGRPGKDENRRFFAGMFGFNRGDQLQKFERKCTEDKHNWFADQRAFTKLSGKYKELNYNEYVSGEKDIYNPKKLIVRNLKKDNKDKFKASEEYFVSILKEYIDDYEEKYKEFQKKLPIKILAFMHKPFEDWCFLSSIRNVQKYTNLDIEICKSFNRDYLNTLNPDVVWSRGGIYLMTNFFGIRPDLKSKTISTITMGGELLEQKIKRALPYLKGSKGLIVQNKDAKTRMEHRLKEKNLNVPVYEIPNGVDLNEFKPKKKPNKLIIGYVGRNRTSLAKDQKGWTIFKYVREILEKEGFSFKLSMDTQNKRTYEQMKEFYNEIDFLLLPSHSEGHSNTINEAMASGLPVLTTKVGWHGENCKDELIWITRNVWDIVNKFRWLKQNPTEAQKIGKKAQKFAERHLNIQKTAKEYERVLRESID